MRRLLHRLWLWIWYLLPANPILVRVVCGASRRIRHLGLRLAYLTALLLVVLLSLIFSASGESASLTDLAKGASQTFKWGSMTQLALMCFLAPVFTAGAITQERDALTLNILLSTPLTSAQIVFGSLMSRLYFVIALLLAGVPIFLMTMVYGGVTTSQVIESFAISGSTAILTGALAIFVAMMGVGTRRTIFSFYLLIAVYLLSVYLLAQWDRAWLDASEPNLVGRRMSWLTPLHPFLALEVSLNSMNAPAYGRLADHSAPVRYALAYPSAVYVAWTSLTALALTISSIVFVRRGAKIGEPTLISSLLDRFRRRKTGERTRAPRSVWNNPVAWREAKTRASGGLLLRWIIIAGGFAGPTVMFFYYLDKDFPAGSVPIWLASLIMIQFALALIIATNTAATSITKEKESQSLSLLLTTPLTSRYILWGKLRGLVSFALPLVAGPVVLIALFGVHGALFRKDVVPLIWIETAFELAALLVLYTALACVVGLWRSLSSRRNVTAVMYSVGLMIGVYGLTSLVGFAIVESSGGEFGAFLAPFTPFTSIRFLVDPASLFGSAREYAANARTARTAALVGSIVAVGFYSFVVWNRYTALVRNFDMTLRKQSGA